MMILSKMEMSNSFVICLFIILLGYAKHTTAADKSNNWENRQVFLHFDGVESVFYLWINGKKIGYSQGSRTPAEFNITKYLQQGKNVLAAIIPGAPARMLNIR